MPIAPSACRRYNEIAASGKDCRRASARHKGLRARVNLVEMRHTIVAGMHPRNLHAQLLFCRRWISYRAHKLTGRRGNRERPDLGPLPLDPRRPHHVPTLHRSTPVRRHSAVDLEESAGY